VNDIWQGHPPADFYLVYLEGMVRVAALLAAEMGLLPGDSVLVAGLKVSRVAVALRR
jgi:hypothetical protein